MCCVKLTNRDGMKLSRKQEILISLLIAAVFGVVWGSLFVFSTSRGGELSIVKRELFIEKGHVVSAQSLRNGAPTSYVFPPPLYVFEWAEFNVDVENSSGVLQINFTRDSDIIRSELVEGSRKIVLSGYGEYRIRPSNLDVTFQALNADVTIEWLYVGIDRGLNLYNPLTSAIGTTGAVAIIILLTYRLRGSGRENAFQKSETP